MPSTYPPANTKRTEAQLETLCKEIKLEYLESYITNRIPWQAKDNEQLREIKLTVQKGSALGLTFKIVHSFKSEIAHITAFYKEFKQNVDFYLITFEEIYDHELYPSLVIEANTIIDETLALIQALDPWKLPLPPPPPNTIQTWMEQVDAPGAVEWLDPLEVAPLIGDVPGYPQGSC